jgi:hypothetical protein
VRQPVVELFLKFPTLYGTRRIIAVFTRARSIQSIASPIFSLRSISIFSTSLRLGLPIGLKIVNALQELTGYHTSLFDEGANDLGVQEFEEESNCFPYHMQNKARIMLWDESVEAVTVKMIPFHILIMNENLQKKSIP